MKPLPRRAIVASLVLLAASLAAQPATAQSTGPDKDRPAAPYEFVDMSADCLAAIVLAAQHLQDADDSLGHAGDFSAIAERHSRALCEAEAEPSHYSVLFHDDTEIGYAANLPGERNFAKNRRIYVEIDTGVVVAGSPVPGLVVEPVELPYEAVVVTTRCLRALVATLRLLTQTSRDEFSAAKLKGFRYGMVRARCVSTVRPDAFEVQIHHGNQMGTDGGKSVYVVDLRSGRIVRRSRL